MLVRPRRDIFDLGYQRRSATGSINSIADGESEHWPNRTVVSTPDKRDYRNVGIGQKPVTDKRTYQDLARVSPRCNGLTLG
jgi:hypothetical protein